MDLHGSILPFTQHGLEKYNDAMTKDYFRATSHKGEQCLIQVLQKQNRMEYMEAKGIKRAKRHDITCSKCKEGGLMCRKPCTIAMRQIIVAGSEEYLFVINNFDDVSDILWFCYLDKN